MHKYITVSSQSYFLFYFPLWNLHLVYGSFASILCYTALSQFHGRMQMHNISAETERWVALITEDYIKYLYSTQTAPEVSGLSELNNLFTRWILLTKKNKSASWDEEKYSIISSIWHLQNYFANGVWDFFNNFTVFIFVTYAMVTLIAFIPVLSSLKQIYVYILHFKEFLGSFNISSA